MNLLQTSSRFTFFEILCVFPTKTSLSTSPRTSGSTGPTCQDQDNKKVKSTKVQRVNAICESRNDLSRTNSSSKTSLYCARFRQRPLKIAVSWRTRDDAEFANAFVASELVCQYEGVEIGGQEALVVGKDYYLSFVDRKLGKDRRHSSLSLYVICYLERKDSVQRDGSLRLSP